MSKNTDSDDELRIDGYHFGPDTNTGLKTIHRGVDGYMFKVEGIAEPQASAVLKELRFLEGRINDLLALDHQRHMDYCAEQSAIHDQMERDSATITHF